MKNPALWALLLIVILALGGWWWYTSSMQATPTDLEGAAVPGAPEEEFSGDPKDGVPSTVTVVYTDAGFVPSSVTVAQGGTVTFIDQSAANEMWVASLEHPTHTQYDGTNKDNHCPNNGSAFDQCTVGSTYSFTFAKVGTWGFHNHREEDHKGSVIVR